MSSQEPPKKGKSKIFKSYYFIWSFQQFWGSSISVLQIRKQSTWLECARGRIWTWICLIDWLIQIRPSLKVLSDDNFLGVRVNMSSECNEEVECGAGEHLLEEQGPSSGFPSESTGRWDQYSEQTTQSDSWLCAQAECCCCFFNRCLEEKAQCSLKPWECFRDSGLPKLCFQQGEQSA